MDFTKRQKSSLVYLLLYMALILLLMFFSNSLKERTLPKVTLYYAGSGFINGDYYDTVIPRECIFDVGEKGFIFLAEETETPLGIRVRVRLQTVQIRAVEEGMAAIRPLLETKTAIVQSAQRMLEDGEEVYNGTRISDQ